MEIQEFQKIVNEFEIIKKQFPKKKKTFMEVAGFPHYENVISNILAFLFSDSEEHGFSNLWASSLLSVACGKEDIFNINVIREQSTENNKRIDLLLFSENYVVCIENKIYADLYNDLNEYEKQINRMVSDVKKEKICVVLSLFPLKKVQKPFVNVTYQMLFDKVSENMSSYIDSCDNTWHIFIKDFIRTIEELEGGHSVNSEFGKFFHENMDAIIELNNQIQNYNKQIDMERNTVLELLKNRFPKDLVEKYCKDKTNPIKPYTANNDIYSCIFIDFTINNIVLESYLDYNGWHISVWKRTSSQSMAYVNTIREYFLLRGIELSEQPKDINRNRKVVLLNLPSGIDPNVIVDSIIDIMISSVAPYLESIK